MQVEDTQLFRVKAVASMFDVSPATVYRLVESGELPALRFSVKGTGTLRITGEAINAYLKRAETLTEAQADGLACVICGADFLVVRVAHYPVGRSRTGSQVFACTTHRDTDTGPASGSDSGDVLGEVA